jgi:hypothetical protein
MGPRSEKLSEEQVEPLELEPRVHAQELEKESGVSSGRKRLIKRERAGPNALPDHLPRREEIVEGEEWGSIRPFQGCMFGTATSLNTRTTR